MRVRPLHSNLVDMISSCIVLLMVSPLLYVMSHDFFLGVRPDSQTVRQTGTVAVVIRMRRGNKGDPRRYRKGGWLKREGIREQGEEFCPKEKMEGVFYLLLFFLSDFLESTSLKRFLKGGHSRRIFFPLLENTPRLDP